MSKDDDTLPIVLVVDLTIALMTLMAIYHYYAIG